MPEHQKFHLNDIATMDWEIVNANGHVIQRVPKMADDEDRDSVQWWVDQLNGVTNEPWVVLSTTRGVWVVNRREETRLIPAEFYTLDAAVTEAKRRNERERLFVAAPDLLAALRELSAMYAHTWDLVGGGLTMMGIGLERFEKAHAAAVEAIAKAEGRTV